MVSGSVYLVGEARSLLLGRGCHMMRQRPNPLPRLYRWRTNLIQTPLFAFITAAVGTPLAAGFVWWTRKAMRSTVSREFGREHCVWVSWFQAHGARRREPGQSILSAVYASNHTSYMDTPVIFAALPFQFRILAKKELWPIPFIGWYLNRSGQIPIDTANPRATLSSLGAGAKALRSGMPLFVFPEGGRTLGRRTAAVSFRRGLPGDSRAGSAGAHCAGRGLRSAADSHPPFLSRRAHASPWASRSIRRA